MGTARLLGFPLVSRLGHQIAGSLEFDSSVSATWDFINGIYLGGSSLSYTGSGGTYFNSAGNLTLATTNQLRFDHDPVTHAPLGILIEGARTNRVPDNTGTTATVGTIGSDGAFPTGWSNTAADLTQEVVAKGTVGGIDYVDIRFSGTPSSTSANGLQCDAGETITAGQTWAVSGWLALVAGSMTNVSDFILRLADESGGTTFTPTGTLTRYTNIRTATGTSARWRLRWNYIDTVTPVDFTLRVGLPQRELGASISSPIRTTGTVATRAADVLTAAVGGWLNVSEGTLIWEYTIASLSATRRLAWAIHDGTGNNRILALAMGSGGTQFSANMTTGGVSQVDLRFDAVAGQAEKVAYAWKVNDIAVSRLGGAVSTDIGATIPTGLTSLNIGHERGSDQMFGHLRRISYIPRRVSNVILQGLSS